MRTVIPIIIKITVKAVDRAITSREIQVKTEMVPVTGTVQEEAGITAERKVVREIGRRMKILRFLMGKPATTEI